MGQSPQISEAGELENFPGGQSIQDDEFEEAKYFPTMQAMQSISSDSEM
jgi:hypothetical protein